MSLARTVSRFVLFSFLALGASQQAPGSPAAQGEPGTQTLQASPAAGPAGGRQESARITRYTLSAERYRKARNLGKIQFRLSIIGFFYGAAVLWFLLRARISSRYRSLAEQSSPRRFVQCLVFVPLLLLTIGFFELPEGLYHYWISRAYGLSVQSWGSWFLDWTKGQLVTLVVAMLLVWILYAVIRKSPRRCWLYFWMITLPLGLLAEFLQPLVLEPLFFKYEPLAVKAPELTASLQRLVAAAGESIPPERMFWMNASEKTTAVDAYVSGFGSSKRIVVLDTTIAKATTPQIVFVAGHEMGHYVLGHIVKGLALGAVFSFAAFYLAFVGLQWILGRWGPGWGVRSLSDWASLPAMLLLLAVLSFVASPLSSGLSRYMEHQADQYGLEVTHGLTPDSGQVAAQTFQILGEVDLGDPDPSPVDVFLFYSHPPISERVGFALAYDPWSRGRTGEFVK